jgi:hypothetical protein
VSKKITRSVDGKDVEELYDPNVNFVVEEIGKLAGQYVRPRIVIGGPQDGSMPRTGGRKGARCRNCRLNRAELRQEAIVRKFATLQPETSSRPAGLAGTNPADSSDPDNNA